MEFDQDHPVCERPIGLGIGRESFFEISNDVVGKEDYNALVKLFRGHKWTELKAATQAFRETYETSPLREAVTFLEVQSLFDQDSPDDEEIERTAEKKLRSALLLYPKSEFAPVITATAGAHWLRTRNFQRSLGLYEIGASTYPAHPLFCTFLMGIGENHFLLRKFEAAETAFGNVLAQCKNFRLRAAARIRSADVAWALQKPDALKNYAVLMQEENPYIERFYQPTIANLGEVTYLAGDYNASFHHFNRYLKVERNEPGCRAYALKRLADIAARTKASTAKIVGQYLAVYEKYPKSDIGRFSYAHGLLMDPELKEGGELERRLKLVDNEIDKIGDEELRSRIFLEKGITFLDLGRPGAVDYLTNLRGKTRFAFETGPSGSFIRKKILALLEAGKLGPINSNKIEETTESLYMAWLKDTADAKSALRFYARTVSARFVPLVAEGKAREAIEMLKRWRKSVLWPSTGPDAAVCAQIGNALLKAIYDGGPDSSTALVVSESKSTLEPFLNPSYKIVSWLSAIHLNAGGAKGGALKWERDLASTSKKIGPEETPLFRIASAQGLRLSGDLVGAKAALAGFDKAVDPKWEKDIVTEKIELAKASKEGVRVFQLLKSTMAKADAAGKKKILEEMAENMSATKTWSLGEPLIDLAKQTLSDPKDLGIFYHLAARALFETKQCKQAIPLFENAFRMNPEAKQTAESRFRLGKCWISQKNPESARQEWAKVIDLKDSFWSPLAKSEIQLLSP